MFENEIESVRIVVEKVCQVVVDIVGMQFECYDLFLDLGCFVLVIVFQDVQGQLLCFVFGVMLKDFGQEDDFGGMMEGQIIVIWFGVNVILLLDGWVVYLGLFRFFGELLILNIGDGYYVLLVGMDRIDVELGQFVLVGELVGVMGLIEWVSVLIFGMGLIQLILYVEFWKDGCVIDFIFWWVCIEEEKVCG